MNIIITNHSYDSVISGGDVIACEYAKCWSKSGNQVILATHEACANFLRSRGINNLMLAITPGASSERFGILIAAIVKTFSAIFQSLFWSKIKPDVIFSSSWMWTDLFPALILKMRFPQAKLIVGCYLLLNHPSSKSYGASTLNRWILWLVYILGMFLVRYTADMIWTASPMDAKILSDKYKVRTYAIRGGVDVNACKAFLNTRKQVEAVFMGRFHPQKNILELIEIWKSVNLQKPKARLLIIGDGFLKKDIHAKIKQLGLTGVVDVTQMLDGDKKLELLAGSKLFVSASHFDSGNLSLDEAMACGTPGIVYDMPLMIYPKGVKKISRFDKASFAKEIVYLLEDELARKKLSNEALVFGRTLDWEKSAENALVSLVR